MRTSDRSAVRDKPALRLALDRVSFGTWTLGDEEHFPSMPQHQLVDSRDCALVERLQRLPEVRGGLNRVPDGVAAPAGSARAQLRRPVRPIAVAVLLGIRTLLGLFFFLRLEGAEAGTWSEEAVLDLVTREAEVGEHAVHVEGDAEGHGQRAAIWSAIRSAACPSHS